MNIRYPSRLISQTQTHPRRVDSFLCDSVIDESGQRASLRFAHCGRRISRQHQPLQHQAPGGGAHGCLIVARIRIALGDGEAFIALTQALGTGRSQWQRGTSLGAQAGRVVALGIPADIAGKWRRNGRQSHRLQGLPIGIGARNQ